MEGLMIHMRGSKTVTKDELELIPLPQPTESYVPVPHYQLADTLTTIGRDILKDYVLIGENYGIARNGNQLFAVLKFQNENPEMALSIGFRNSYDKSTALGIAMGASVFCCDNLALQGEMVVMKKHTKNIWTELEDVVISTLYRSQQRFHRIVEDSKRLKARGLDNDDAFRMLGLLFGKGVLSPRQLPTVKGEWLNPGHEEFRDRNLWSFFNAVTEALKTCPPITIMEKHVRAYNAVVSAL